MKKIIRQYRDVNGKERTMTLIEENVRLVEWSKYAPISPVNVYKLDDGSIVHIPENAWVLFGIGSIIREIEVDE